MAVKASDVELDLIGVLSDCVRRRLPDEPPAAYTEFVRQYYRWVPARDLADRRTLDLCGAVVAHFQTARQRRPGEVKVNVYNPDLERDGWHSPFTVVEIVSDDMPFIVDSVTMELSRQGYGIELVIHPVMRLLRDADGELIEVLSGTPGTPAAGTPGIPAAGTPGIPAAGTPGAAPRPRAVQVESVIHAEVGRQTDSDRLAVLRAGVELVLEEVRAAVDDWAPMRARATALAAELGRDPPPVDAHEVSETQAFLRWLADDHFTFLGYREYELGGTDPALLRTVPGSGLGILRGASSSPSKRLDRRALELAHSPHPLVLTKANSRATVHRPAYLDYIGVKRYGPAGEVTGERRLLGLYTTAAYKTSPREIPLLRGTVQRVLARAAYPPDSHDAKRLIEIIESLPRDLLVSISTDDLFDIAMGILGLGERPRVRLFVCVDRLDRFVAGVLCLPRDRFNTENLDRAARILGEAFGGGQVDWRLQLSESVVVRVHYVVHCRGGVPTGYDVAATEAQIVEATRAWSDDLRAALVSRHGEEDGLGLQDCYGAAFPASYRADWSPRGAVADIDRIGELQRTGRPVITLYRRHEDGRQAIALKLLSGAGISLSEVLPTFEHMGARVVDERPYEITLRQGEPVWIYDFGLDCAAEQLERVAAKFAETFRGVWAGELEDDGLNGLVLAAGLTGREITVIRCVARYLPGSDCLLGRVHGANPGRPPRDRRAARAPVPRPVRSRGSRRGRRRRALGPDRAADRCRFEPGRGSHPAQLPGRAAGDAAYELLSQRGGRTSADLPVVQAGLDRAGAAAPAPTPVRDLRLLAAGGGSSPARGRVARGGLRWSDRREDFRTEVLGLMKAQMVKNALIVPVGSKGGFVVKRPRAAGGREAQLEEAIACYRIFLRGLLDLTDNYVADGVAAPARVVRYDDDDPYLVVAADKGTASFSDIANEVSAEYGFWLGDAFASGGSHGYDHKQMGVTARGAWEAVKRHFRELGTDVQSEALSVVGIGDMSGDVFGNGMLCSSHIRLLAAFNHQHVFLDPDPDPAATFAERRRLFELPRSSWADYDSDLISPGGGVYPRAAKAIPISAPVRRWFGIEARLSHKPRPLY